MSSCSASVLMLASKRSSYPKNSLSTNRPNESPKHASLFGSNKTILTGIPSRCRTLGDKRKKPYSNEYSTIYSPLNETKKKQK